MGEPSVAPIITYGVNDITEMRAVSNPINATIAARNNLGNL